MRKKQDDPKGSNHSLIFWEPVLRSIPEIPLEEVLRRNYWRRCRKKQALFSPGARHQGQTRHERRPTSPTLRRPHDTFAHAEYLLPKGRKGCARKQGPYISLPGPAQKDKLPSSTGRRHL